MEMNILIDLSWIRKGNLYTGIAKYAYRFLEYIVKHHLEKHFILLLNGGVAENVKEMFPQEFRHIIVCNKKLLNIPKFQSLYIAREVKNVFETQKFDLIFCPHGDYVNRWQSKSKKITTIHDLQMQLDGRGLRLMIMKKRDDMLMKYSESIVTISNFSKEQIRMFYPWYTGELVSLGNSISFVDGYSPRLIEDDYILYVGRICKMKNIVTLIKAYASIKGSVKQKLVIVGTKNTYWEKEILPIIISEQIQERIILYQGITEKDLNSLYKFASLFVFPSLREGFGFPPLEAAAMGCPVICSTSDSLQEVTMGLLYYYEHPMNDKELAEKMMEVLDKYPDRTHLEKIAENYKAVYSVDVVGKRIYDYLISKIY